MSTRVAILGTGRIGSAIARRCAEEKGVWKLFAAQCALRLSDETREAIDGVQGAGPGLACGPAAQMFIALPRPRSSIRPSTFVPVETRSHDRAFCWFGDARGDRL
jgi:hypothetical protein